ncbi:hypothetical protein [Brachybacterium hainanense]|uniref:DUF2569 family protein n=1 Tax=Brachybacterium hainanense TaxID=1541174 RepID=A0ABV6RD33_9MICO
MHPSPWQPVPSAPPPVGHRLLVPVRPLPPAKRGYGVLVLVGAALWGIVSVIGLALFYATFMLLVATLDPAASSGSAPDAGEIWSTAPLVLLAIWGVIVLVLVGLDLSAAVLSIQRLVTRVGDPIVPWFVLCCLAGVWLLPALDLILLVLALEAEQNELAAVLALVLWLLAWVGVPLLRTTQLVVGIVRTATGERPRTT